MKRWTIFLILLLFSAACRAEEATAVGFLRGDFAFIPYEDRVQVVDIANVTNPQFVTEFSLPGSVVKVVVNGRYLYIAHSTNASSWDGQTGPPDAGLQIVDVLNPAHPRMLGQFHSKSLPTDLLLFDGRLFLATWDFIDIIDVKNVAAPHHLGTFSDGATSLALHGDRLAASWGGCSFLTDYCEGGFKLFDLADPERPSQIGELQFDELPGYGVALADDYAFATGKGLSVVDLADLDGLRVNGRYPLEDDWLFASKILLDGDLAYTIQHDGLYIFDLSQPTNPQWIGAYPTGDLYTDLTLRDGRLYLTGWFDMLILDVTDPTFPDLLSSYPIVYPLQNPFQPTPTP